MKIGALHFPLPRFWIMKKGAGKPSRVRRMPTSSHRRMRAGLYDAIEAATY